MKTFLLLSSLYLPLTRACTDKCEAEKANLKEIQSRMFYYEDNLELLYSRLSDYKVRTLSCGNMECINEVKVILSELCNLIEDDNLIELVASITPEYTLFCDAEMMPEPDPTFNEAVSVSPSEPTVENGKRGVGGGNKIVAF